jgi:carbon starvation protein
MDTGVRLQRYIIQEIATIINWTWLARSLTWATVIAVAIPLALALMPGDFAFGTLWRLFGTTNQLTAGLALSVVAVWVFTRNRNPLAQIVPLTFLLAMTTWALFLQLGEFFRGGDYLLTVIDAIIFVLALWLIIEAIVAFRRARGERAAGGRS